MVEGDYEVDEKQHSQTLTDEGLPRLSSAFIE